MSEDPVDYLANYEAQLKKINTAVFVALVLIGSLLVGVALTADMLGIDLTPGFGMVQMAQLLFGMSCLTLAAFLYVRNHRPSNKAHSLQADIGVRLAATGLAFAYIIGFADLIGIGTHIMPRFERPFVGPFQLGGLILCVLTIVVGWLLYLTSRRHGRSKSSMEFLVNNGPKNKK